MGGKGLRSLLIGVPPSFPPPKDFPGWRVGCFLTPPSANSWAFPAELETEFAAELGDGNDYIFDIPDFRRAGYTIRFFPTTSKVYPEKNAGHKIWLARGADMAGNVYEN